MTRVGKVHCDTCSEQVEASSHIRYKGKDFHKDCFNTETLVTDQKKNPPIKMVLQPKDIKTILEVMETFMEVSESPGTDSLPLPCYKEIKRLYPEIALRLAEAGRGFGVCSQCGKASHYDGMVAGGESKKGVMKIMKLFQVGCKGPVVKELVAEEASRVLLFCDDECDKAFAAKPIDKQLKNTQRIKDVFKAKAAAAKSSAEREADKLREEEEAAERRRKSEKCVECGNKHATFQCADCNAWLGQGACVMAHQEKHDEEDRERQERDEREQNEKENEGPNTEELATLEAESTSEAPVEAEVRVESTEIDTEGETRGLLRKADVVERLKLFPTAERKKDTRLTYSITDEEWQQITTEFETALEQIISGVIEKRVGEIE